VILISGSSSCFAALGVEFAYQPPYWVHAMLWLPLIALTTLGPLRPIKGVISRCSIITRLPKGGSQA